MNRTLTRTAMAAFAAVLLSATVYAADNSLPMVGSQWAVYEQATLPNGSLNFFPGAHATTIPASSGGGVYFVMPDATSVSPSYVNYLLDTYTISLDETKAISAVINVVPTSGTPAFAGNPDGGCPNGICPGAVRLFFQSNLPANSGSSCTGSGYNQDNYWWSNPVSYTFATGGSGGSISLSASLSSGNWSNLCGEMGSSDSSTFDAALANIKYVGLSFGSGSFFANGIGVDGATGAANFQLLSYTIN